MSDQVGRQQDEAALYAIRVLDAWAKRNRTSWGNDHHLNNGTPCWCVLDTKDGERWIEGATPDAARITAAEALLKEDVSLEECV